MTKQIEKVCTICNSTYKVRRPESLYCPSCREERKKLPTERYCIRCGKPIQRFRSSLTGLFNRRKTCDDCHGFKHRKKSESPRWKGGVTRTISNGYVYLLSGSLVDNNRKAILEHRAIWEEYNGPIPDGYHIHHINGKKTDNRIENLTLMLSNEHFSLHNKGVPKRKYTTWGPTTHCCVVCQTTERSHFAKGQCRRCYSRLAYRRRMGLPITDCRLS